METIKVNIPNMKSAHCQSTVSDVVKNAGGSVTKIAATQADITVPEGKSSTIIAAIEKAGYRVSSKL